MPEQETKLQLGDNESSAFYMMNQLAQNNTELNINIDGDQLVERTKLFMISHARQQLNRIIKMTKFMEKLEDKFIDAVNSRLDDEPGNISMISMAMETVTKCLESAESEVFQILKDDRLKNLVINTTNIITPDGTYATIIDADSRDEVRNLASSLLKQLQDISNEQKVVDATAKEEDKEEGDTNV